ncbi:hypothetical protein E2F47_22245 [Mycobacterium eburneum]|nr:hypothetical protein E2F47_22245 [Mycobacterium eburneum]
MVTPVAGTETPGKVRQRPWVSVHTFAADYDAAEAAAQITHQRMLMLGPPIAAPQTVTVTLGDGTTQDVTPDYVITHQIPIWEDYQDDLIFRFVARYEIALRFTPA